MSGAMRRVRLPLILAGSVLVNLALLGLAPLLSHERDVPEDEIRGVGVSLVSLKPPEPPKREKVEEPKPPKPEPKTDFTPDLVQPQFSGLGGGMDLGVIIDLGGVGGVEVGKDFAFESYELDQEPQPLVRVQPVYPYRAREQGIEGVVQVKVLVNADGSVGQVLIVGARPKGIFEDAVLKTVPQYKFSPGKIEGEAVTSWVTFAIRFTL